MIVKKSALSLIATTAIMVSSINMVQARDQIRIVGSSTVYPFSSSVAEEFGATSKSPTPVVESTGSGGGMKLFCKGNGLNTPDITNASRRMKTKEFKMCEKNGVTDITEAVIGFDGIAIAQNKKNKTLELSKKHLLLAVAEEVPSKDGKSLVKNPSNVGIKLIPICLIEKLLFMVHQPAQAHVMLSKHDHERPD